MPDLFEARWRWVALERAATNPDGTRDHASTNLLDLLYPLLWVGGRCESCDGVGGFPGDPGRFAVCDACCGTGEAKHVDIGEAATPAALTVDAKVDAALQMGVVRGLHGNWHRTNSASTCTSARHAYPTQGSAWFSSLGHERRCDECMRLELRAVILAGGERVEG